MPRQQPPIQPAGRPGPAYDPLDRIIQDLMNIESFVSYLADKPKDLDYLNSHLSRILGLRRTLSHELKMLADAPYFFDPARLTLLEKENEMIFIYLEGIVGSMKPLRENEFNKFIKETEKSLLKFEKILTPS